MIRVNLHFPMGFPMDFLRFARVFRLVSSTEPGPRLPLHRDQRRSASRSEHRAAAHGRAVTSGIGG